MANFLKLDLWRVVKDFANIPYSTQIQKILFVWRLFRLKPSYTFLSCLKYFRIICEIIVSEIFKSHIIDKNAFFFLEVQTAD